MYTVRCFSNISGKLVTMQYFNTEWQAVTYRRSMDCLFDTEMSYDDTMKEIK